MNSDSWLASDWKFKGEGGASVVLAYRGDSAHLRGKVLRLKKWRREPKKACCPGFRDAERALWEAFPNVSANWEDPQAWSDKLVAYARDVFGELLPPDYIGLGVPLDLSPSFLQAIEAYLKARPLVEPRASEPAHQATPPARPSLTPAKVPAHHPILDPGVRRGLLMDDYTFFHAAHEHCGDARSITPAHAGTGGGDKKMPCGLGCDKGGRSDEEAPGTICVEIKPKCGFLRPASTTDADCNEHGCPGGNGSDRHGCCSGGGSCMGSSSGGGGGGLGNKCCCGCARGGHNPGVDAEAFRELKSHVTRFTMHQQLKLAENKIAHLSAYCPLDLFSGEGERVASALRTLVETPQNNLRVFVDGRCVHGGYGSVEGSVALEQLNKALHPWLGSLDGSRAKGEEKSACVATLVRLLTRVLAAERDTMAALLAAQMRDTYDVDGALQVYQTYVRRFGCGGDQCKANDPNGTPRTSGLPESSSSNAGVPVGQAERPIDKCSRTVQPNSFPATAHDGPCCPSSLFPGQHPSSRTPSTTCQHSSPCLPATPGQNMELPSVTAAGPHGESPLRCHPTRPGQEHAQPCANGCATRCASVAQRQGGDVPVDASELLKARHEGGKSPRGNVGAQCCDDDVGAIRGRTSCAANASSITCVDATDTSTDAKGLRDAGMTAEGNASSSLFQETSSSLDAHADGNAKAHGNAHAHAHCNGNADANRSAMAYCNATRDASSSSLSRGARSSVSGVHLCGACVERWSDSACAGVLRDFLIAATAKDCALMITLQRASVTPLALAQPLAPVTTSLPSPSSIAASRRSPASSDCSARVRGDDDRGTYCRAGTSGVGVEECLQEGVHCQRVMPRDARSGAWTGCPVEPRRDGEDGTRGGDDVPPEVALEGSSQGHAAVKSEAAEKEGGSAGAWEMAARGEKLVTDEDGRSYRHKVSFIDLDLKPLSRIPDYFATDVKIVRHFLEHGLKSGGLPACKSD